MHKPEYKNYYKLWLYILISSFIFFSISIKVVKGLEFTLEIL